MKNISIAFYDTKPYDKESFLLMNKNFGFNIEFFDFHLNEKTAFSSKSFNVICAFVNDILDETVINILKQRSLPVNVIFYGCLFFFEPCIALLFINLHFCIIIWLD